MTPEGREPRRRGGLILAGGASSRMGTPKAEARIGGELVLTRIVRAMRAARCSYVVICARAEQEFWGSGDPDEGSRGCRVLRVDDPPELAGGGPLVGLGAGLRVLIDKVDLVYLCGCDAVRLTAPHLEFMMGILEDAREFEAAVPCDDPDASGRPRLHCLASTLRVRPAAELVERLLRAGERRARAPFGLLRSLEVPVASLPDAAVVAPCNTPEQWRLLTAGAGTSGGARASETRLSSRDNGVSRAHE